MLRRVRIDVSDKRVPRPVVRRRRPGPCARSRKADAHAANSNAAGGCHAPPLPNAAAGLFGLQRRVLPKGALSSLSPLPKVLLRRRIH